MIAPPVGEVFIIFRQLRSQRADRRRLLGDDDMLRQVGTSPETEDDLHVQTDEFTPYLIKSQSTMAFCNG